jgi:predicted MPP superfamily phosphohydrolase
MSAHARLVVFFLILTLVLGGLSYHVYRRVVSTFEPPRWLARALALLLVLGLVLAIVARVSAAQAPQLASILGSAGGAITLGVLISSVLLLPYDLARGVARVLGLGRKVVRSSLQDGPAPASEPSAPSPARRAFLARAAVGGAVSVGMGASLYGTFLGRRDFTLETVPIRLAKLPRQLDGFSVVQLSDLHVGLYVGDAEFARALELVQRAKPDIVVLTGDLLDHDARYAPQLGRFVRALRERAPRGLFAIPGNHDYYAGVAPVEAALREAGAEVLTNRHVVLGDRGGSLVLAGLDDVMAPDFGGEGPRLERAFRGAPPDLARILLSHNPSYFSSSYASADLTLSGHTHGGQITLFINPAELVLRHGFVRGHYSHPTRDGESQLYVNRGFGTAGPPARVGSAPEITKLVLTSG